MQQCRRLKLDSLKAPLTVLGHGLSYIHHRPGANAGPTSRPEPGRNIFRPQIFTDLSRLRWNAYSLYVRPMPNTSLSIRLASYLWRPYIVTKERCEESPHIMAFLQDCLNQKNSRHVQLLRPPKGCILPFSRYLPFVCDRRMLCGIGQSARHCLRAVRSALSVWPLRASQ